MASAIRRAIWPSPARTSPAHRGAVLGDAVAGNFPPCCSDKYELVSLTRRAIHEATLPTVRLVDTECIP